MITVRGRFQFLQQSIKIFSVTKKKRAKFSYSQKKWKSKDWFERERYLCRKHTNKKSIDCFLYRLPDWRSFLFISTNRNAIWNGDDMDGCFIMQMRYIFLPPTVQCVICVEVDQVVCMYISTWVTQSTTHLNAVLTIKVNIQEIDKRCFNMYKIKRCFLRPFFINGFIYKW